MSQERSDPASFLSVCDPGIEWDVSRLMREFWRSWVGVHQIGSCRGSGAGVEQRFGQVWTVRNGVGLLE